MIVATKKTAAKAAAPKASSKKSGSVLSGFDGQVKSVADELEKAVKSVGGDIPRGLATEALAALRSAEDKLFRAEREDA